MGGGKGRIMRISLDLVLCATMFAFLIISLTGVIAPEHTRVSCNNPAIRMPYHQNTVPVYALILIAVVLPLFVIIGLEYLVPPDNGSGESSLCSRIQRSSYYIKDFLVGVLFVFFVTDVMKTLSGAPRPLFWSVCAPNITEAQCNQGFVGVTWRDCTNPKGLSHSEVVDSMKSFPSGHASITVFSSIYVMVYIRRRLWNKCSSLLAPWLQLLWLSWTIFCCQSRIWDNWHHWWDVLAGIILGAICAFLTLHYLSHWFFLEGDDKSHGLGDPNYPRQEESSSSFSQTSIRRLISTNSDTDNHAEPSPDNRELTGINGTV